MRHLIFLIITITGTLEIMPLTSIEKVVYQHNHKMNQAHHFKMWLLEFIVKLNLHIWLWKWKKKRWNSPLPAYESVLSVYGLYEGSPGSLWPGPALLLSAVPDPPSLWCSLLPPVAGEQDSQTASSGGKQRLHLYPVMGRGHPEKKRHGGLQTLHTSEGTAVAHSCSS